MSMTAQSMAQSIRSRQGELEIVQTTSEADAKAFADQSLEALCQGIIDEITGKAVVTTTSGAPDGEHTGKIS